MGSMLELVEELSRRTGPGVFAVFALKRADVTAARVAMEDMRRGVRFISCGVTLQHEHRRTQRPTGRRG
jgi:hypothetical protein